MSSVVGSFFEPLVPHPYAGDQTMIVSGWPWWWAMLGWFAAAVASSGAFALTVSLGAGSDSVTAFAVGQIGLWVMFSATALLASRHYGTGHLTTDFRFTTRLGEGLRALAVGIALQLVLPVLYYPLFALGFDVDVSGPAEALFKDLSTPGLAVVAAGVVAGAPVAEELLFRGVLLRGMVHRFGHGPGLWLSAVFFAGTHFQLVQFPGLLVVGLVLGWLAVRTGGLAAPIWAHIGFNATTTVVLVLQ